MTTKVTIEKAILLKLVQHLNSIETLLTPAMNLTTSLFGAIKILAICATIKL